MRAADYFGIAFRNVRRQLLRSFLTVIALGISTCVLVLMVAISLGGQHVILNQFGPSDSLSLITVTPSQSNANLSPFGDVQEAGAANTKLNDTTVAQLAALPHVQVATPRAHLWEFDTFKLSGATKTFVAQAEGVAADAPLPLQAGTHFTSNDEQDTLILGYAYAKAIGLSNTPEKLIGSTLTITTQKGYRGAGANIPGPSATKQQTDAFNASTTTLRAKVVGVTQPGPNQNFLFLPLGWAHGIRTAQYNDGGTIKSIDQLASDGYTSIQVKVDSLANVASVAGAIRNLGYGQASLLETVQQLNQLTTTIGVILGAVAAVAMLAAALGVVNTMIMAVSEQRYEIGIWRACGARRRVIVRLFLTEAALLGVIGGAFGVAVSLPVANFITSYGSSLLQAQGLEQVPIANLSPQLGAAAIGVTVIFSVFAGLYPAYRASMLDPSRTLSAN
jgi:putative ABC transport system permease protein